VQKVRVRGRDIIAQLLLLERTEGERTNFIRSPDHTPFRGAGNRGTRGSITPSLLDGLRVLVDDEAGMLELMRAILEQYGAQVTAVTEAKRRSVLTANPGEYDVLLSDIGMPDQDGYALIRQVRHLVPS